MEKDFAAMLKFAVTGVGDEIETTSGEIVEITRIDRIEAIDYQHILIHGMGLPIKV